MSEMAIRRRDTKPPCVCGQPEGAWGCGVCDDRNDGRRCRHPEYPDCDRESGTCDLCSPQTNGSSTQETS